MQLLLQHWEFAEQPVECPPHAVGTQYPHVQLPLQHFQASPKLQVTGFALQSVVRTHRFSLLFPFMGKQFPLQQFVVASQIVPGPLHAPAAFALLLELLSTLLELLFEDDAEERLLDFEEDAFAFEEDLLLEAELLLTERLLEAELLFEDRLEDLLEELLALLSPASATWKLAPDFCIGMSACTPSSAAHSAMNPSPCETVLRRITQYSL